MPRPAAERGRESIAAERVDGGQSRTRKNSDQGVLFQPASAGLLTLPAFQMPPSLSRGSFTFSLEKSKVIPRDAARFILGEESPSPSCGRP